MSKLKINAYLKGFQALLKGDTDTVLAERNWRLTKAALDAAIPARIAEQISLSLKVEVAQENLRRAELSNGQPFTTSQEYLDGVINAKNVLIKAEKELEAYNKTTAYLEDLLKRHTEEQDAE